MKKIILFAAACVALAACNKSIDSDNSNAFVSGQKVTLTVGAGQTKVTSELVTSGEDKDKVNFKWATGDKIKVTVGGNDAEFTLKSGEGTSSATFEGTMPAGGTEFDVQYPYTTPTLSAQTYSSSEAIPHDKMLLSATGCTISEGTFALTAQNAALRLNLYGTSQTISKIVVSDASSNTYTLSISPAVTLPATEATAKAFFVVVPAGTYKFSAEIFDNAATPESICKLEPANAQIFSNNEILNMPAAEVKKKPAPEEPLSGKFSVSATKQVQFSKGNLWTDATASPQTWSFETNQYDYQNTYTASHVSHFYWETTGNYGSAQACQTGSGTASDIVDWGVPYCTANELPAGSWYTLSGDELDYLFDTRTVNGGQGDEYSFWQATIRSDVSGGVFGAILFPDDYTSASGVQQSYTAAEWAALESAGCAFLPNIGVRTGSTIEDKNPYHYWACTAFEYANNSAYCFGYFNLGPKTHAFGVHAEDRSSGAAVRLVCDAK